MKKLFPALALGLVFCSCENPIQTMGDMKDTTTKMSKTTQGMSGTTQEMKRITNNMYVSLRQQASEETRALKWKALLSKDTDKSNAIRAAKILFMSFEFQVWYGKADGHGLYERENRILAALEELFMSMSAPYEKLSKDPMIGASRLSKMSPIDLDAEDKNLERFWYSLAATMHFTNDFQEETLIPENKKLGIEVEETSLYDVIKSALLKEHQGRQMTEAESYVTLNTIRKMTIDLLNARISMLTALALKEITDQDDMTLKEKTRGLIYKATGGSYGSLQLDNNFVSSNTETRSVALERFDAAVKTKALLEEIGEEVSIQEDMRSVLENLQIENDALAFSAFSDREKRETDNERFRSLRLKLLESSL